MYGYVHVQISGSLLLGTVTPPQTPVEAVVTQVKFIYSVVMLTLCL